MMRVIIDTNVIVSALLSPSGSERQILRLGLSGEFRIAISQPIFREYEIVLKRPELKLSPTEVNHALVALKNASEWFESRRTLGISPDEADNRFLECAEVAKADYLITGNKKHFPKYWKSTKIINAKEFIEAVVLHLE